MKIIFFTVSAVLLIVSVVETEAKGTCLPYAAVCTKNSSVCCSGLACDCYIRFEDGVEKGEKCWCIDKGVTYTKE
uniref:U8-Lycotoxin-Lsp1a_1 n=1 Tax=Lycosa sp. SGP-2016 TaxID=1905177 RepID=A0A482Z7V4_9ARAC